MKKELRKKRNYDCVSALGAASNDVASTGSTSAGAAVSTTLSALQKENIDEEILLGKITLNFSNQTLNSHNSETKEIVFTKL